MLYISVFDAKEGATMEEINREREAWVSKGKDKVFEGMCKSIERYEVAGVTPLRIVFLIETDDPQALNVLTRHFGNYWDSVTYPAIKRGLFEALEEDRTITCG